MADDKNYFLYKRQYPDVNTILSGQNLNLNSLIKDAVFVVDTNTLLVPYDLGQETLDEIKRIYTTVIDPPNLMVTAHSLREFAKNRSAKISDIYTEIDKSLSSIPAIKQMDYPILGELDAYKKLTEFREEFATFIKPYKDILKNLQSSINAWNWFDPVTQLYSEIFKASNVIDTTENEDDLAKQFEERMKNNVPPGNKDAGKDVNAIGDYLIWRTILEYGKAKQVNIVLVTNDEKNDWLLKGNKKSISTRFELVDEYARFTGGKQFICMNFADFLKIQGASAKVVTEVAKADVQFPKNSTPEDLENELNLLKSILEDYLANYGAEETYILSDDFENTAKYLMKIAHERSDLFSSAQPFGEELRINLNKILSLNYNIHYQSIRMKRSTLNEEFELRRLCKKLIDTIDNIMFFYLL